MLKPSMRPPAFTILLMATAALAVLGAGSWMARRSVEVRVPVNRAVLRDFAESLDAELSRLQERYEQNLRELAGALTQPDVVITQEKCRLLRGIRSCTFFSPRNSGNSGRALETSSRNSPATGSNPREDADRDSSTLARSGSLRTSGLSLDSSRFPVVTASISSEATDRVPSVLANSEAPRASGSSESLLLDLASIRAASDAGGVPTGWVHKAPFSAFWMRTTPDFVTVLVVDWRQVAQRTNEHLQTWITAPYASVRATGDAVALEGPGGLLLAGLNTPPQRLPDFVLPLRKRQGQWQLLAWDRTGLRQSYDLGLMGISAAVAAVLAVIGVALYRHQRDALRLAEARVSFVNRVSHELGSPLTNMLLNLDLAQEQIQSRPESARQHLRLVTEEAERLSRLVKNVLTFSRTERNAHSLKPQPCFPDDTIAQVLQQFEPALQRRGVEIEWEREASVRVILDSDALAQIVGNLVSNVEKYAAGGKWLRLVSHWDADTLTMCISDAGPGIPEQDRLRIFDPFERVYNGVNEGSSGTGLGLAIARDLAARMGGTLALRPSESGSQFELQIPAPRWVATPELAQPVA